MAHRRRTVPLAALALLVVIGFGFATPAVGRAADSASVTAATRSLLVSWLNRDRAAAGLRPLRLDTPSNQIAFERAGNIAGSGTFSHAAAGPDLLQMFAARGAQAYQVGETLGWSNARGTAAAAMIYELWHGSPEHWRLLMSDRYNYVGVGAADGAGRLYVSLVLAESNDRTQPGATVVKARRDGATIDFAWSGYDPQLQTHTAGLRDFEVQYRVDGGPWRTIRSATGSTALVLRARAAGHRYGLRIRARDRNGNLSAWSAPSTVRIP